MLKYIKWVIEKFHEKPWEMTGAVVGFLVAILFLVAPFWKVLFVIVLTVIGYWAGKIFGQKRDLLKKFLDRILPRNF